MQLNLICEVIMRILRDTYINVKSPFSTSTSVHAMSQKSHFKKISFTILRPSIVLSQVGPWYSFDNGPTGQNNLLGPHWYTSNGLLVAFDPDTPYLHVGFNAPSQENLSRKWGVGIQNATRELLPLTLKHGRIVRNGSDGLLRIQSRRSYEDSTVHHPLKYFSSSSSMSSIDCEAESCTMGDCLSVRVALCTSKNAAESVRMALSTLQPPGKLPDRSVLRSPIWTTWARYKTRVNQAKVLRYAEEIVCRGMQRSVMEIDDKWQTLYGDLTFDPKKFPDPVGMIDALHELGFKVTCCEFSTSIVFPSDR